MRWFWVFIFFWGGVGGFLGLFVFWFVFMAAIPAHFGEHFVAADSCFQLQNKSSLYVLSATHFICLKTDNFTAFQGSSY